METPQIILDALHRRPRRNPRAILRGEGGGQKNQNNFVAEGKKKQAGAPLGNRHAMSRDPDGVERQERLARLDRLVQQMHVTAATAIAAADRARAMHQNLAALLAEPRP